VFAERAPGHTRALRRWGNRVLAFGAFAAAAAAAVIVVFAALGSVDLHHLVGTSEPATVVKFGPAHVERTERADGSVCFTVSRAGVKLKTACAAHVRGDEISYVVARRRSGQLVLAGVAGAEVRAVFGKLRPGGAIGATPRDGAFYTPIPPGRTVRAVEKVLRDGSRRTFPVT
jgi:hypothetical protein